MRKVEYKSDNTIRFRKWSRKAYSIFASLHRHVTIGQVCNSITDASMSKSSECMNGSGIMRSAGAEDKMYSDGDIASILSVCLEYMLAEGMIFVRINDSRCGTVPCNGEYIIFQQNRNCISVYG